MTTGSNAGYPDVIQVPSKPQKHDMFCPSRDHGITLQMVCGYCEILRAARADERDRIRDGVSAMPTAPKSPYGAVFKKDVLDVIDDA